MVTVPRPKQPEPATSGVACGARLTAVSGAGGRARLPAASNARTARSPTARRVSRGRTRVDMVCLLWGSRAPSESRSGAAGLSLLVTVRRQEVQGPPLLRQAAKVAKLARTP